MLLREIFEAAGKTAVIIYGRMNPPTIGHKRLMEELKSVAAKNKADAVVFLSHTQNKKTDPLTFDQKVMYAHQMFPDVKFAEGENSKTFPSALQYLQQSGYTKVVHLVGSDRLMGFKAIIDSYNGKPDKSGTIPFKFDEYEFVSLDRDPDAEGATGMSASKARALAVAGDVESFKLAIPGDDTLTMALYRDVREGMGIKETEPAESVTEANYGRYWCSTDKKWKTRKGPKQSRK